MSNASGTDPRDEDRTEVIDQGGTPPASEAPQRNGLGIAALVVGIVAAVLAVIPVAWIAGIVLAVIGLVLGIIALTRADRQKGVATAGTVVSAAALVLAVVFGVLYATGALGGSPAPTASPTPTATPTETPTETPTPTPTPTPEPTVQEWADQTWGTFSAVDQDGTGDQTVAIPAGATGGIVTATVDGGGLTLQPLDSSGSPSGPPLVQAEDDYDGTTAWGVSDAAAAASIRVTATGSWTLTIAPMSSAPELPGSVGRDGDAVFLYGGDAATLAATHSGDDAEDPFVVSQQTAQEFGGAPLIDVTGSYDDSVPLSAGPSVLTVHADEDWTMTVG
ncbi:DUF4190 domain-containing protein [Agromyces sp. SYSU T0242]|uniref:DUF4190 domain-containing protein n=1 Tax=Agromyces litoreus TaxID=3158561 RepID=UPI0033918F42